MKKILVLFWLIILLTGIAGIFWYTDIKYSLPTPIPSNYKSIALNEYINLDGKLNPPDAKPLFIHFFNPDCPCSKFNIEHFKYLVKRYGEKIDFSVVVITKNKKYTKKEIEEKFGLNIPVSFDESIAALCGVYSTPQAVLLDEKHKLYYRGNYNKNRYCTNPETNFAQQAIDALLNEQPLPNINNNAFIAYGCQLPSCNK